MELPDRGDAPREFSTAAAPFYTPTVHEAPASPALTSTCSSVHMCLITAARLGAKRHQILTRVSLMARESQHFSLLKVFEFFARLLMFAVVFFLFSFHRMCEVGRL